MAMSFSPQKRQVHSARDHEESTVRFRRPQKLPHKLPTLLPLRQRPTQEALAVATSQLQHLEQLEKEVAQPNAICTALIFALLRQLMSSEVVGASWRPILMTVLDFLEEAVYPVRQCGANAALAAATISSLKPYARSPIPQKTPEPGQDAPVITVQDAADPGEEQTIALLKQGGAMQCTPYFAVSRMQREKLDMIRQELKKMPFLQRRMKVIKPQLLSVLCNMSEVRKRPWKQLILYAWRKSLHFARHVRDALEKVRDMKPLIIQRFFAWVSITKVERARRAEAALQKTDAEVQQLRRELQSLRADMDDDVLASTSAARREISASQTEAAKARGLLNSYVEALRPGTLLPLAHAALEDLFRRIAEVAMFWDLENFSSLEFENAGVLINSDLGPPLEGEEGMGPDTAPEKIPLLPVLVRWVNFHVKSLRKIVEGDEGDDSATTSLTSGGHARSSFLGGKRQRGSITGKKLDFGSGLNSPKSPSSTTPSFPSPGKNADNFRSESPDTEKSFGPLASVSRRGIQEALSPKAPAALSAPLVERAGDLADGRAIVAFLTHLRLVVSGGDGDFAAEALDCLDEPPGEKRIRRILMVTRALLPPDAAQGLDLLHPRDLANGDERGILLLLSSMFANSPALPPAQDKSPLVINMLERTRELCSTAMIRQLQNPARLLTEDESFDVLMDLSAEDVLLRWSSLLISGSPRDGVESLDELLDNAMLAKLLRNAAGELIQESSPLAQVAVDVSLDPGSAEEKRVRAVVRSYSKKLAGLKPSNDDPEANAVFLGMLFLRLPRLDVEEDSELAQHITLLKDLHDEWATEVRGLALQINSEAQRVSNFSEKRRRRISVEVAFAASTAEPTAKFASFYTRVQAGYEHIVEAVQALEKAHEQFTALEEKISAWSVSQDLKRSKSKEEESDDDADLEENTNEQDGEKDPDEDDDEDGSLSGPSRSLFTSKSGISETSESRMPVEVAIHLVEARKWGNDEDDASHLMDRFESHQRELTSLFETYADADGKVDIWSMRRLCQDWGLATLRNQKDQKGKTDSKSETRFEGHFVRQVEEAFAHALKAQNDTRDLEDDEDDDSPQRVTSLELGGFIAAIVALSCTMFRKDGSNENTETPTSGQGDNSPSSPLSPQASTSPTEARTQGRKSQETRNSLKSSVTSTSSRGSRKSLKGGISPRAFQTNSSQMSQGDDAKSSAASPKAPPPPPTPISECFKSLMSRPFDQEPGEDRRTVEMPTAEDALNTLRSSPGVIQVLRKEGPFLHLVFNAYADHPKKTAETPLVTAKQAAVTSAFVHGDALGVSKIDTEKRRSTRASTVGNLDNIDHSRENIGQKNNSFRYEMLIERVVALRRGYMSNTTENQEKAEKAFGLSFCDFCDCIVVIAAASNPDPFAPVCPKVEKVVTRLFQGLTRHWEDKKETSKEGVDPAVQELLTALLARSESKYKRKSVTFGGQEERE
eukprot:gnl/MRDRNA2_/MRDRNA2_45783_c0_seq1.p1 gnl/MRDRNA2_/MRDRNA2_45783_c0~~gnl/MRDRNA2_/MRDRNA2_45783_c0_seq1.p1  ORF type:complete len:1456 (+),score=323.19 gnl/MRDRNA2_/MRDRNA2_45783_c0_seq1:58-4425(+)